MTSSLVWWVYSSPPHRSELSELTGQYPLYKWQPWSYTMCLKIGRSCIRSGCSVNHSAWTYQQCVCIEAVAAHLEANPAKPQKEIVLLIEAQRGYMWKGGARAGHLLHFLLWHYLATPWFMFDSLASRRKARTLPYLYRFQQQDFQLQPWKGPSSCLICQADRHHPNGPPQAFSEGLPPPQQWKVTWLSKRSPLTILNGINWRRSSNKDFQKTNTQMSNLKNES